MSLNDKLQRAITSLGIVRAAKSLRRDPALVHDLANGGGSDELRAEVERQIDSGDYVLMTLNEDTFDE